jgi:amino acid adenylation domain-containing protein
MSEFPASHGQAQVWFVDTFHADVPLHNIPILIRLEGLLDEAALGRALDALIDRHGALRTRLVAGPDARPVQVVDPPGTGADLRGVDPCDLGREARRRFDLEKGPLLRARLARLGDDEHLLLLVTHAAVFDRPSALIVMAELASLYEGTALPPAPQYAGREEHVSEDDIAYWREVLDGFPNLQMPTDRPRPIVADHLGAVERLDLDLDLPEPQVTLPAALQVLLSRYTGQYDIVTGVPGHRPDGPLVGPATTLWPLRTDLSDDPAFTDLAGRVRRGLAAAAEHGDIPFARLVEELHVERDTGRPPVFQAALTVQEIPPARQAGGVRWRLERIEQTAARFDLDFFVRHRPGRLEVELSYATSLFDAGTARRLLGNLRVLLEGVAADPARPLSRLPLLTPEELHRELVEWNDTDADLPVVCIHHRFERQASRTPSLVAAELGEDSVTYAELEADANRIARHLRGLGVEPETMVGVSMVPSPRRLAVLLGIMKAGGAYVPLDPALPADRLSYMIADTAMPVIVADGASAPGLPETGAQVIDLDHAWPDVAAHDPAAPGYQVRPDHLAYVIYTSGSTGRPKGVMVEHRHAINFLVGMVGHWKIGPGDRVLQFASLNFDVSVMDMFMTLLSGATAVLAPPETLTSPPRLADLMRDRRVTFACLPPAVVNLLSGQEFPTLRLLLSAGEELSAELVRRWLRPGLTIYNGYGPTEAAIGAVFCEIDGSVFPPPIGRPKPNYRAYVLDPHLNPVPVGVAGELHIGGRGVTRGYLNAPELTAERFIRDPFTGDPDARLYKTGDLVKRLPDGRLVFLGRIDDQVKIRGLRVELGEIETALVTHPSVAQAVVVVTEDRSGHKQLAGYVRMDPDAAEATVSDLRQHLARRLPAYMVPTHLMVVETFPLTSNKKIDKRRLPAPETAAATVGYLAPRTMLEAVLADTYARLLGREQVGADNGFFDLGGDSLQAMRLVTELRTTLAVDLDISAIFLAPTPRQLTVLLRDKHGFEDADLSESGVEGLAGSQT